MDFTLFIFGNANGDMNIDQQDIDLLNEIAAGKSPSTDLADANQDGVVDAQDVEQVRKIIDGTASVMWVQMHMENLYRLKLRYSG
jgi:iron complex transport system substrate-binding protein